MNRIFGFKKWTKLVTIVLFMIFWLKSDGVYSQYNFFSPVHVGGKEFKKLKNSAVAVGDVNNDGLPDVFLCGQNTQGFASSSIYLNEGAAGFAEMNIGNAPLEGVIYGGGAFGDSDGDGFPELLLFGWNLNKGEPRTYLYKNNGGQSFAEMNIALPRIISGFALFGDIDGDGDLDLIIGGISKTYEFITNMYKNDGSGNFSLDNSTSLPQLGRSQAVLADLNNDGHLDLVITGLDNRYNPAAFVLINDGNGGLVVKPQTELKGVYQGSVSVADVNGDGFSDLFLTGSTKYSGRLSALYINDGTGSFSQSNLSTFNNVWISSTQFADVNKDGHMDLIMTGSDLNYQSVIHLYLNNGLNAFSEVQQTNLEGEIWGDLIMQDFDKDGDPDLIITGENYRYEGSAVYYSNTSELLPEAPVVNLGADTILCRGQHENFVLEAGSDSSGNKILWNTGDVSDKIVVDTSGTYSVVVTNIYGQSSIDSITVWFKDSPELNGIVISKLDSLTFDFEAEGANIEEFYWNFGDGSISTESNPSHKYELSGEYIVLLIASNPCGRDTVIQNLSIILSTNDISRHSRVRMYPNPSSGYLNLHSAGSPISTINVINIAGTLLINQPVAPSAKYTLDLSVLEAGNYFVRITLSDGSVFNQKLSIIR